MSLSKKVVLTVSGYKISLSDSLQFYKNDQLKLIFEINKYGIDVASSFTHKTLMPLQPLTATLFIETPLGVDSIESANIEDNAVTFYLTSNQTQHVGTSSMQIKLTDDDGCQITLPSFTFEVQENIYDGAVQVSGILLADENGNTVSDENGNTVNATATTETSKQIKDFTLKTGVSGQEDILVQDNGVTKRIKSSELIDTVDLSGYATKDDLSTKADVSSVPTKTSQLTNDTGMLTSNSITRIEVVNELPKQQENGVLYIVKGDYSQTCLDGVKIWEKSSDTGGSGGGSDSDSGSGSDSELDSDGYVIVKYPASQKTKPTTWCALGDSITYGTGAGGTSYSYANVCATQQGISVINNYGVPGTCVSAGFNTALTELGVETAFCNRFGEMSDGADLITVFGSVNDHGTDVKIGSPTSTDKNDFYGALYVLINGLKQKYPNGRIVFITPFKINGWDGTNMYKHTLKDFRNAIVTQCNRFQIEVVDLFLQSQFDWSTGVDQGWFVSYDHYHPTAAGQQAIATYIGSVMFEENSGGSTGEISNPSDTALTQQYSSSHEATPNIANPPSGAYNWKYTPRINPDGSFPNSTWNAFGHWMTTYKVEEASYYDNVGLLLQNPKAWIWNTSTNSWDVLSSDFEWGSWYLEDFYDDGNSTIANSITWENGASGNHSTWVKIKQDSTTQGRCFHPWGYQKNWRSNSAWSNNGQPYIVTKIDFKLVKYDENGIDNLDNAQLVVNSGGDWWSDVGAVWKPDWSTNRDMCVGKYIKATRELKRAWGTNLPSSWSYGLPMDDDSSGGGSGGEVTSNTFDFSQENAVEYGNYGDYRTPVLSCEGYSKVTITTEVAGYFAIVIFSDETTIIGSHGDNYRAEGTFSITIPTDTCIYVAVKFSPDAIGHISAQLEV